jgi:hypothetical protein
MWESINPPWVGSGWRVSKTATGLFATGSASSATNFRLSAVVRVSGCLIDGSSVDEVISIKAAVPERPSNRRYESAF